MEAKTTKHYRVLVDRFGQKLDRLIQEEWTGECGLMPKDILNILNHIQDGWEEADGTYPKKSIRNSEDMRESYADVLSYCQLEALTIVNDMDFRDLALTGKPFDDVQMVAGRLREMNDGIEVYEDAQHSGFNGDIIKFCALAADLAETK